MLIATVTKAASGSGAPWWAAPGSALVGIVIGFALKAWFDILIERRRERREDRLRFMNEKMQAYADLGMHCHETTTLLGRMAQWSERRTEIDRRVEQLMTEHGDASIEELPEIADLRREFEDLERRRIALDAQADERVRETGRLNALVALIAPLHVAEAAERLTSALAADDVSEQEYDEAFAMFIALAGLDLGREIEL